MIKIERKPLFIVSAFLITFLTLGSIFLGLALGEAANVIIPLSLQEVFSNNIIVFFIELPFILFVIWLRIDLGRNRKICFLYGILTVFVSFFAFAVNAGLAKTIVFLLSNLATYGKDITAIFMIVAYFLFLLSDIFLLVTFIVDVATGNKIILVEDKIEEKTEIEKQESVVNVPDTKIKKPVKVKKIKEEIKKDPIDNKKHVYHIRKTNNLWYVSYAGGKSYIESFTTQKEAISFVRDLISKYDGTYFVRNSRGKNKDKIKY